MKDDCVPLQKNIPPGDEASPAFATLPVSLTIKPASVVVEGDTSLVYGIEEFPSIAVRVGVPVQIPVPHGNYMVHVIERTSGRRVTGTLNPGREVHIAFPASDAPSP